MTSTSSPQGPHSRRRFLTVTTAGAAMCVAGCGAHPAEARTPPHPGPGAQGGGGAKGGSGAMPRRELGATGVQVSALCVGGSHLGEKNTTEDEAIRIVHEALDSGIDFFDNAWEYHDGVSEVRLGKALAGKRDKAFLMTKVCTHGRDAQTAMTQLEQSLNRLKTDHLDLWQVHECIHDNDPELHYAAGGVLEALTRAKKEGKVRFVGFTGHKDPSIHLDMLQRGFPFDTVQMPLNCFDGTFRSFEQNVLPVAQKRRMGILGMKSMAGNGRPITKGILTAEEALRYALSLPVSAVVSGMDSLDVLRQNLAIVRRFTPMSGEERAALRERVKPEAGDGRYELYKTTMKFDGPPGREQHGLPTQEELPL